VRRIATLAVLAAALALAGATRAEKAVVIHDADLRSGAGFGRSTTGRIHSGDAVEVVESTTGWVLLRGPNGAGWARDHAVRRASQGDVFELVSRPASADVAPTANAPLGQVHAVPEDDHDRGAHAAVDVDLGASSVTPRTLYLRPAPSFDVALVGRVPSGESVQRVATAQEWTQVRAGDGAIGWVRTEALAAGALASATLPEIPTARAELASISMVTP
jgi:uncharacterized protein YgiM (DUF1202 family)